MSLSKVRTIIASDVNDRDGIGIEVYKNDELILEIFRDDTLKIRTIKVFTTDVPLGVMEEAISEFKGKIDWSFIDYENLGS
jgi:hypothetical protein